jgi:peptidoglycan/LPS O-acetylase OafA/YrhL
MEGSSVSERRPAAPSALGEPGPAEVRSGRDHAALRIDQAPGFHLGYQPGLDGIRGIAVVLIIMFHSFILWPGSYGHLVPGAYITVNMFFVLSGFLITSLLLEEHHLHDRISFSGFYQRRALRLLPALAFVLAVHLI